MYTAAVALGIMGWRTGSPSWRVNTLAAVPLSPGGLGVEVLFGPAELLRVPTRSGSRRPPRRLYRMSLPGRDAPAGSRAGAEAAGSSESTAENARSGVGSSNSPSCRPRGRVSSPIPTAPAAAALGSHVPRRHRHPRLRLVETVHDRRDALGGSAMYFAGGRAHVRPGLVGVAVGTGSPPNGMLAERGVDVSGVEVVEEGKTFRWGSLRARLEHAPHHVHGPQRLENFEPAPGTSSDFVFLANAH